MSSVFEGGRLDFDAASAVESRCFAACAMSRESRNMIGTRWYQPLARGFEFVLQIGKTPNFVDDSRVFHTSRVFGTYVMEGLAMLKEGVHPRSIEVAGLQAGMPMLPLALHVADQTKADLAAEGKSCGEHPGMAVVRQFINALGAAAFVARLRELAAKIGRRFEPARVVVEQAASGGRFAQGASI